MAARFLVGGGTGNWTSTTNWAATSGGASGVSAPGASDDVTFDTNSGATNITLDTSARNALSWNVTSGYTGTVTFTNTLTVVGSITLGANMTFAGASALIGNNTATFTSNGKAVGVPLTFTGTTHTVTLADAMVCSGLLSLTPGTTATITFNGFSITTNAGVTVQAASGSGCIIAGTTTLTIAGTGVTITAATTCRLGITTTINATSFTVSGNLAVGGGTFTYTAGTPTVSGATLTIGGATTSVATAGITWPTVAWVGNNSFTYTLLQDINCVDLSFSPNTSVTMTIAGAFDINCSGNLSVGFSATGIVTSTTALINMTGATAVYSHSNTAQLRIDLDINTAGTFTISGQINYNTRTMRWVAGTLAGASSPIVRVNQTGTVFDFAGQTVPWVLSIGGTSIFINLASNWVFSAAGGITCTDPTAAAVATIRSNSSPTQRKLTIVPGCTIDVGFCNFTDIDCGDGDPLWVYKGTLSNTTNIEQYTPYTSPFSDGGGSGGGSTGSFG